MVGEVATWPALSVARKATGVPFATYMLVAQLPQFLRVRGCHVPPLTCMSTFVGLAEEVTLTSCHQVFELEATVKEAEKVPVPVVLGLDVVEVGVGLVVGVL